MINYPSLSLRLSLAGTICTPYLVRDAVVKYLLRRTLVDAYAVFFYSEYPKVFAQFYECLKRKP